MTKPTALSTAAIHRLESGALADLEAPGLAIIVAGAGKKVWRFKHVIAGTKTVLELRLSRFPEHMITDARAGLKPLPARSSTRI